MYIIGGSKLQAPFTVTIYSESVTFALMYERILKLNECR